MQVSNLIHPSSKHIHILSTEAKSQLTKANQTKAKMENLARELQKVKADTCAGLVTF